MLMFKIPKLFDDEVIQIPEKPWSIGKLEREVDKFKRRPYQRVHPTW